MQLAENLRIALRGLRANRLRVGFLYDADAHDGNVITTPSSVLSATP